MLIRTIPRTATRQIEAIKAQVTSCKVHTLDNGFIGKAVEPRFAWDRLAKGEGKLTTTSEYGKWVIRIHSNCWYELVRFAA